MRSTICLRLSILVFFLLQIFNLSAESVYRVPDLKFETIKSGGFRVYFSDPSESTQIFSFHANVNKEISNQDRGDIYGETYKPTNGTWILEFSNKLEVGAIVNYWFYVTTDNLLYRKDRLSWRVPELLEEDATVNTNTGNDCSKGTVTVVNGEEACSEKLIFEDNFEGPAVDTTKWTIQHRIPTYTGPDYEFNSYENLDETRFTRDGKLYIKPNALYLEKDVEGILDLRQGCTGTEDAECFYQQRKSFILPPVKSAKITTRMSFKYGTVEIKAKLPVGEWIFPILELEPKDKHSRNYTKLRVAYSRGNSYLLSDKGVDLGSRLLYVGLVMPAAEPGLNSILLTKEDNIPYNEGFHVYTLVWTPSEMGFLVDGEFMGVVKPPDARLNQEHVLSLGVGVGGISDFPDNMMSGSNLKPWENGERYSVKKFFDARNSWLNTWHGNDVALQVEYVKIWALK